MEIELKLKLMEIKWMRTDDERSGRGTKFKQTFHSNSIQSPFKFHSNSHSNLNSIHILFKFEFHSHCIQIQYYSIKIPYYCIKIPLKFNWNSIEIPLKFHWYSLQILFYWIEIEKDWKSADTLTHFLQRINPWYFQPLQNIINIVDIYEQMS